MRSEEEIRRALAYLTIVQGAETDATGQPSLILGGLQAGLAFALGSKKELIPGMHNPRYQEEIDLMVEEMKIQEGAERS